MTVPAAPAQPPALDECAREPIHAPGAVQPHAVLLVVDADGVVVQASAGAAEALGLPGAVPGSALDELLGAETAARLAELDQQDGPRTRSTRLRVGGREVDVCRSAVGPGLSAFEVEPVEGAADGSTSFEDAVTEAVTRIQDVQDPVVVIDQVCGLVAELTGFERVMGYRFQPDDHGVVVAERAAGGLEPFLGLHYPASDIPPQARALYLRHWLRLIPDAAYTPVPLVPAVLPATGAPLDMTGIGSRAVSPVHCQYLANMGVRASMSISVVVGGRLWGLIACHHYSGPRRPSIPVRQACEFVALAASVVLGSRAAEQRAADALAVERRLNHLAELLIAEEDLTTGLMADPALLVDLVGADGAAVVLGAGVATVGTTPERPQLLALVEAVAVQRPGAVVATDAAPQEFPVIAPSMEVAAGVLALPLSSMQRNYLLWFRRQWRHDVRWGGDPAKPVQVAADGSTSLRPRASFAEWVESVEGRSRPWEPDRLAAVEKLRDLLARHISRTAEQLTRLNTELVRSNAELDAFAYVAAHDLKEPLRGLANYATFLAEDYRDVLGEEGRQQLDLMLALTGRMNGLLTSLLGYARVGRSELRRTTFPLSATVAEVIELVQARLAGSGATIEVVGDHEVSADNDLFTQVVMNLVTNALKYNTSGAPRIEIGVTTLTATGRGVETVRRSPLTDAETPVLFVRDNGIGIPADRLEDVFRVFRRLHGPGEFGGGEGAGLTIARRIVERHGGLMWVESTEGAGSTFYFTLAAS